MAGWLCPCAESIVRYFAAGAHEPVRLSARSRTAAIRSIDGGVVLLIIWWRARPPAPDLVVAAV
ncbi:hypothetical protein [Nocardia sp. NPDC049707]|uniref:hypothetical protein n=1 Tax=Nocardia sp. NPDC049707 TaxID=3154735 RepID=UPI003439CC9A